MGTLIIIKEDLEKLSSHLNNEKYGEIFEEGLIHDMVKMLELISKKVGDNPQKQKTLNTIETLLSDLVIR